MTPPPLSFSALLRQPSAYLPVAMSLGGIATILVFISLYGTAPQKDEGWAAHLWQLLMVAQVPILLYFAIKWVPRSPKNALLIIALQIGSLVAAVAPVFLLGW